MPQIIPMKDLRDTSAISERCHASHEPLFVTKNGYGDLVIMSIETYEELENTAAIDAEIAAAEESIKTDGLRDAKTVLAELRREYFG